MLDNRLFFPATKRNNKCIGDELSKIFTKNGSILEIGSGSGKHGVIFQKRFPEIIWQTSDPEYIHRKSIVSWIEHEKLSKKMPKPLEIDVTIAPWNIDNKIKDVLQAIICINMIHIASWRCTQALFKESGKLLLKDQFLYLYGPFKIKNKFTTESNYLFDKSLKIQNKNWGIRNLENISEEASRNDFFEEDLIPMPSNNFSLIYRKISN